MEANLKLSGNIKQANPSVNNTEEFPINEIIGVLYSLSSNNWKSVIPQERKHKDSYKLLIGKCEEINHLESNWKASNKFKETVINLIKEKYLFVIKEIKEIGSRKRKI